MEGRTIEKPCGSQLEQPCVSTAAPHLSPGAMLKALQKQIQCGFQLSPHRPSELLAELAGERPDDEGLK